MNLLEGGDSTTSQARTLRTIDDIDEDSLYVSINGMPAVGDICTNVY